MVVLRNFVQWEQFDDNTIHTMNYYDVESRPAVTQLLTLSRTIFLHYCKNNFLEAKFDFGNENRPTQQIEIT